MKQNNLPQNTIILFGPTGSGKTALLLELFKNKEAEIVSADSMQVYRGMDIGTAKPSAEEQTALPHHLIDIRDPSEQFNAGDFVRLAKEACAEIAARGKIPVVSGGTGFYLKNLIMGLPEAPPGDAEIRAQLKKELAEHGALVLMEELKKVDPVSAERIHINDEYRLLRALEVWRCSGKPLSSFNASTMGTEHTLCPPKSILKIFGLMRPREELYNRINKRCTQMFKQGLADEVRGLFEKGYTPDDPGLRAIGYAEFFIKDENGDWKISQDLEGVQALVAQNSRRYAKRQITFFKGISNVKWINSSIELHEPFALLVKKCNALTQIINSEQGAVNSE